jgi:type I restriction enzyme S subunit
VTQQQIPTSWAATTLGSIRVDHSASVDPAKVTSELFELYSIPAFTTGRPEVIAGSEIGSTKKSLAPRTVVVSKLNPRINRVWIAGETSSFRQIGSSEWIPFFPVDGLEPRYLAYYMRQDAFRNYLAANVSGVGGSLMRVRPSVVDPFPFVLAPTAEQHRIVEAIDSYFTRLDDAVGTLERVQRNLKRYRASVLKAAVEGRLVPTEAELACAEGRDHEPASVLLERIVAERRRRWEENELAKMQAKGKTPQDDNWKLRLKAAIEPKVRQLPALPDGWTWTTLDQLTAFIDGGNAATATSQPTSRRVLRSSAVRQGAIDFTDHRFLPNDAPRSEEPFLVEGDLLFTRLSGTLNYVGNCAVVPPLVSERLEFPDRIFRARVGALVCAPYIALCFGVPHLRVPLEAAAKSSAGHQRISLSDLREFHIPLPPLNEQMRIVVEVERLLSAVTVADDGANLNRRRLTRLRQSILKWAFEGRLVDQDPSDEPASVLLERIKAERAATTTSNRKSRRKGNSPNA